jgi:hypothetical protein
MTFRIRFFLNLPKLPMNSSEIQKILLFPTLLQVIIEFVKKIMVLLYQTGQKYFLITQTLLSMKILELQWVIILLKMRQATLK